MNIGNNISALRKEKGITQEELAKALGVSAQAVSKWENNSSCPDVSLLTSIADYFGVSVDALLRSDEKDILTKSNAENDESSTTADNSKKKINIKIVQSSGKENNIKVPFKFVKMGLNIGNMFGLDESISEKIISFINNADLSEILDMDTEKGEHIVISLI